MDDAELARRCAAREDGAWQELLERAGPAAESVIRSVLRRAGVPGAGTEAEGLMGSWVLALLENDGRLLRNYRPELASLPTYLAVVARTVAGRHLRRRKPALSLDPDRAPPAPEADLGPEDRVREALDRLPPRDRLLLRMAYWDRATPAEAAAVLGVSPASIHPLLSRAREALKERLLKFRD